MDERGCEELADGLLEEALAGRLTEEEALAGLEELGMDAGAALRAGVRSVLAGAGRRVVVAGRPWMRKALLALLLASGALVPHGVRPGDTAAGVAAAAGCRESEVRELNPGRVRSDGALRGDAVAVPARPTVRESPHWDYEVRRGDTLGGISVACGVGVRELRAANGLEGDLIRAGQTLRIPGRGGLSSHVVVRGDTLVGIARERGCSVKSLRRANPGLIGRTDVIRPGDVLYLPAPSGRAPSPAASPASSSDASPAAGSPVPGVVDLSAGLPERRGDGQSSRPERPVPAGMRRHAVRRGDSPWGICRSYGVTLEALYAANPGLEGRARSLRPGEVVAVPPAGRPDAGSSREESREESRPSAPSAKPDRLTGMRSRDLKRVSPVPSGDSGMRYVVEDGDTLSVVAARFELTEEELRELNPGLKGDRIRIGQPLEVGTDARVDYVARVLFAESRDATDREMKLIAQLVMNRIGRKGFPGNTDAYHVVRAKNQFACTSGKDGNRNWRDYRRNLDGKSRMAYELAKGMVEGGAKPMAGFPDLVSYCNWNVAVGVPGARRYAVSEDGTVAALKSGESAPEGSSELLIGRPKAFGDVVPSLKTKTFMFYRPR